MIKVILIYVLLKILFLLLILKAQGEKIKMKEDDFVVSQFIEYNTNISNEHCYLSS